MQKYTVIVLLNAREGEEEAFNDWFTNTHVPEVLTVPGMISGQRHQLSAIQRPGASMEWKYLTIWRVESNDVQWVIDELNRRIVSGEMQGTNTIAPGGYVHYFDAITPLTFAQDVEGQA